MMPEKPLDKDAEVAVILGEFKFDLFNFVIILIYTVNSCQGLNQVIGGPWKLVYVFRRLKCLHVYECITHGRQWWFSLHMTTDIRHTLRELPAIDKARKVYLMKFILIYIIILMDIRLHSGAVP